MTCVSERVTSCEDVRVSDLRVPGVTPACAFTRFVKRDTSITRTFRPTQGFWEAKSTPYHHSNKYFLTITKRSARTRVRGICPGLDPAASPGRKGPSQAAGVGAPWRGCRRTEPGKPEEPSTRSPSSSSLRRYFALCRG